MDVAVQKCVAGLNGLFSPGEAWDDVDIELGESDTFYVRTKICELHLALLEAS